MFVITILNKQHGQKRYITLSRQANIYKSGVTSPSENRSESVIG